MAEREILTNAKKSKELGRALVDTLGLLSFLFGSLILLSLVFGMIGSMFMSTKPLFRVKRVKRADDKKGKS